MATSYIYLMNILGLSGGFHPGSTDAAAALIVNGKPVAMAEEERFTRVKNSVAVPPSRAISYCLETAGISIHEVDCVANFMETYPESIPELKVHLENLFGHCPQIRLINHHRAHAASSFYASGWDSAAVTVADWSGDGVTTSIWRGKGRTLELLDRIERPNSLGIFYAGFTQFLGFDRCDEYKLMGLASYGVPRFDLNDALDCSAEKFKLNTDYFSVDNRNFYQLVFRPTLEKRFGEFRRIKNQPITQLHKDFAASVQAAFEKAWLNYVGFALKITGETRLCIAGGGGLNCKANGKIVERHCARSVYVPPFPNDTGTAYGAALAASVDMGEPIFPLEHPYLGPSFTDEEVAEDLSLLKIRAEKIDHVEQYVADALIKGQLVGWFQGGMEVGPRALGARSILADARNPEAKDQINKFVKFRENFRPFAPSVKADVTEKFFEFGKNDQLSPYMSFVCDVKCPNELPAITHIDGTARIHTVGSENTKYLNLLLALESRTGFPVVLNTSFNYMGQPIVCTPKEAIYTYFGTGLDKLVMGNWVISK